MGSDTEAATDRSVAYGPDGKVIPAHQRHGDKARAGCGGDGQCFGILMAHVAAIRLTSDIEPVRQWAATDSLEGERRH
jgi:hypothetical protein